MTELQQTRLVQRLEKPYTGGGIFGGVDNPFSFGGGLKNGGLSDEAMGLLRGIFSFEYMGAAEYEFGAVPQALNRLAQAELVAESFVLPLSKVKRQWDDKSKTVPGEATIYVLAPKDCVSEVVARILELAKDEVEVKMSSNFSRVLRPGPNAKYVPDTCGWLELDNGFMFFTDKDMWSQTCALFGVDAS